MSEAQIRSVSVRFDADIAAYLAKCKLAGAATDAAFPNSDRLAAVNKTIGDQTGKIEDNTRSTTRNTSVKTKATTVERGLGRELDSNARKLNTQGKEIDKLSGRLGILIDLGLALAPALAPIGAELVPATFALGANLGFMGAGLGTVLLGFHGVGDALTKFNKAALEPTATNIHNAQVAMDKLPPSAQRFVLELHRLSPEVEHLQRIAANGLLPGVTDGLEALETDLPIIREGIRAYSSEIGTLGRDTGEALASKTWRPFLRFLSTEGPHALDDLGRAGGHTLHGIATLLMGFEPTTRAIDDGILRLARDFDHWATVTERSKGFEDFLTYLDENGPRVLELLGQTAVTFVDIGRAIAPLGGPTIEILTKLLGVVDGIANSDLGTPLFAGIVAFRLYARVAQLAGVEVKTSFAGMAAAPVQMRGRLNELTVTTRSWARQTLADLAEVSKGYLIAGASSEKMRQRTGAATGRLRETGGKIAKGAALGGGLALLGSGVADDIGLANTATLAMAGSLAGPWGAAVGGAVGLTMDLAKANDGLTESVTAANRALDGTSTAVDFQAQSQAVDALNGSLEDAQKARDDFFHGGQAGFSGLVPALKEGAAVAGDFFTHTTDKAKESAKEIQAANTQTRDSFTRVFEGFDGPKFDKQGNEVALTNAELQRTADRAAPAMQALGITVNDLRDASDAGDGSLDKLTHRIVSWTNRSESARGRTDAVAQAFAKMGDETLTTDQRVQQLTDSLDKLLGPTLGLSAAQDQYTADLHSLNGELSKHSKTLRGNTDAALTNRGAIRSRVTDLSDLIKAEAEAGESPAKMTAGLLRQRKALIDAGVAAGLSRKELEAYLDRLGLTPKLVQTAISLVGTDQVAGQLGHLRQMLEGLKNRTIHVDVHTTRSGISDATATGGHIMRADGGIIPGRGPYMDTVPVLAAPGEFMISNRHGQVDRYGDIIRAINENRYAGGGMIGGAPARLASSAASPSSGGGVTVQFPDGMTITGHLDTPMGPGMMRAIAADQYHNEQAADSRFAGARSDES